jgi:uncharacterized protein (DUF1800 family)
MSLTTERGRIAHLLRRAGFSPSAPELDRAVAKGRDALIEELLNPETVPDDAEMRFPTSLIDYERPATLGLWWLGRMVNTRRPLQEKLTLFWHGHLTSALSRVGRLRFTMIAQNEFFRANALGSFHDIVLGAAKDPAMILWLDNNTNRKGKPNENFARELFELFTLGRDNGYTEQDIREAARAFTGWFQRNGEFTFARNQHDTGEKTIFGQTGPWDGTDVVRMAISHPSTGPFITAKLWSFFAYPDPEQSIVDQLASVYQRSGYSIREVMRTILTHPAFYSERAYHALVKSPTEIIAGFFRSLEGDFFATDDPRRTVQLAGQILGAGSAMGQVLFNPPNVEGWPGGADWVSTTALITRYNFASVAARDGYPGATIDVARLLTQRNLTEPSAIVDYFADVMVDGDLTPEQRQTLIDYLATDDNGRRTAFQLNEATINKKVHGLIHLIATTPQYQLA